MTTTVAQHWPHDPAALRVLARHAQRANDINAVRLVALALVRCGEPWCVFEPKTTTKGGPPGALRPQGIMNRTRACSLSLRYPVEVPLLPWSLRLAHRFAVACAWSVLPVIEQAIPNDNRARSALLAVGTAQYLPSKYHWATQNRALYQAGAAAGAAHHFNEGKICPVVMATQAVTNAVASLTAWHYVGKAALAARGAGQTQTEQDNLLIYFLLGNVQPQPPVQS